MSADEMNSDEEEHNWLLGKQGEPGVIDGVFGSEDEDAADVDEKPIALDTGKETPDSHRGCMVTVCFMIFYLAFVEFVFSFENAHAEGYKLAFESSDGVIETVMMLRRVVYILSLILGGWFLPPLVRSRSPMSVLFVGFGAVFLILDGVWMLSAGRVSLEHVRRGRSYSLFPLSEEYFKNRQFVKNHFGTFLELLVKPFIAIGHGMASSVAVAEIGLNTGPRSRGIIFGVMSAIVLAGSMAGLGLAALIPPESEKLKEGGMPYDKPRFFVGVGIICAVILFYGGQLLLYKGWSNWATSEEQGVLTLSGEPPGCSRIPRSALLIIGRSLFDGIPAKAYSLYVSWYLFLGESEKTATSHGLSLAAAGALSAVLGGLLVEGVRTVALRRVQSASTHAASLESIDTQEMANDAIADIQDRRSSALRAKSSAGKMVGRVRPFVALASVVGAAVLGLIHINATRTTKMLGGPTDVEDALRWMLPLSLLMFLVGNMEQAVCDFPVVEEVVPVETRGLVYGFILAFASLSNVLCMSTIGVMMGRKFTWAPGMLLEPGADGTSKGKDQVLVLANTIMVIDLATSVVSALFYVALTWTYNKDRTEQLRRSPPQGLEVVGSRTGCAITGGDAPTTP